MPADPFAVFRSDQSRAETLKIVWPELYECLAGVGRYSGPPRQVMCVIGGCPVTPGRRVAVARVRPNGHPACEEHIKQLSDVPGGWPLMHMTEAEIAGFRERTRR